MDGRMDSNDRLRNGNLQRRRVLQFTDQTLPVGKESLRELLNQRIITKCRWTAVRQMCLNDPLVISELNYNKNLHKTNRDFKKFF